MINPLITSPYEDEILELIDDQDGLTRSDLQSIVTILVNKIMQYGYIVISKEKESEAK